MQVRIPSASLSVIGLDNRGGDAVSIDKLGKCVNIGWVNMAASPFQYIFCRWAYSVIILAHESLSID